MTHVKTPRVYADTSVFGGCFDPEFEQASATFFAEVRRGRFRLVLSSTVLRELQRAPAEVRDLLAEIPEDLLEVIELDEEIGLLRDAYVSAGVVSDSSLLDAEHIASASIAEVDLIVSWNFRHIVHFEKIRGYHAMNLLHGYRPIPIHSPQEVIEP